MEVLLASFALGAASAAAQGLYRRFKRRRINANVAAAPSEGEVQGRGAAEDGASTDGGTPADSQHPGRRAAAPLTPAVAAAGVQPRSPADAAGEEAGREEQQDYIELLDSETDGAASRGTQHGSPAAATAAAAAAAAGAVAGDQQAAARVRRKRKQGSRDQTESLESGGRGSDRGGRGNSRGSGGQQAAAAAAAGSAGSKKSKQRMSRELKLLQPFGWDKHLGANPLGPEMDSVLHHIQEAVQEAEEDVEGQQAGTADEAENDEEEEEVPVHADGASGAGGDVARARRGRAKRWDSEEEF
ncbi:hypothetical protein ABPG75_004274 [Micractinium tetrahymenae]